MATTNLDGSPLRVEISASLDLGTGIVMWVFDSIDPDTGGPPTGIDDGFLPVNDESGRGEGEVTFTIRPRSGLADGTRLTNGAEIVFDFNPPILTPTTLNVIGMPPIFKDGFEQFP